MRVHYLSHVPFEQLGAMESWFQERDISIGHSLLFAGDALPTPADFDVLVVMGGPMGADDDDRLPWMGAEKGTDPREHRGGKEGARHLPGRTTDRPGAGRPGYRQPGKGNRLVPGVPLARRQELSLIHI